MLGSVFCKIVSFQYCEDITLYQYLNSSIMHILIIWSNIDYTHYTNETILN